MTKLKALVVTFGIIGSVLTYTAARAQDNFVAGVIAPLSGPLAEYGLAAQNGIELARTQHPELFNNIDFIYEDSQFDAKTSVTAFNRLRNSNVSLVHNWGNPTTEAIAPIAEKYQVPLIGMTLDPTVAKGKAFVIRSTNSAADFATVMADYLRKKGFKRIGVVIAENTYVQGMLDGLQKSLGKDATIETIDRYNIQDQDFKSSIAKIGAAEYDAVGVFLISGQVSTFYRQLSAQAVSLPTFGTDFFESTTEIQLAKGGMNGAVYPHLGITDVFKKDYVGRFGNDYQIAYAGNAYDMAMTIGKLFNNDTFKCSAEDIMKRLKAMHDQTGIGGQFGFRETSEDGPHFHFPVQLKKIVGESVEVINNG